MTAVWKKVKILAHKSDKAYTDFRLTIPSSPQYITRYQEQPVGVGLKIIAALRLTFFSLSSSRQAFLLFVKCGSRRKSVTSPSPLTRAQNTGWSLKHRDHSHMEDC